MKNPETLKTRMEFARVYDGRCSRANRLLVLYVLPNGREDFRVGFSVSRKVGNSVVRHRIVRRLREIVRLNRHRLRSGTDMVVVARTGAAESGYTELEHAFLHLAGLHHILQAEEKTV